MTRMRWWIIFAVSVLWWASAWSWGSDKVLLRELSAITLHQGQMTTGRRSSPVPQLKCIGGTSGCGSFIPQTVQCRNVGYDGYDVQWECKTDMDDSYRFGKIQVTCEGYDYPDDPYVLKGSCGLEYTIDSTEAGKARSSNYGGGYNYSPSWNNSHDSGGEWFIFVIIVFAVVFMICKMGSNGAGGDSSRYRHDQHYRGAQRPYPGGNPPPPGFKPEYAHHGHEPPPSYTDATSTPHYSASSTHSHTGGTAPTGGGGFWSGLGLGGVAGYLFGSRRNYGYRHHSPGWGYGGWNNWGNSGGWGNSWGGGNSWGHGGSSWSSGSTTYRGGSRSSSSGTSRTASGFGGTSRR